MILIVGETFVNLGTSECGKTVCNHSFNGLTRLQERDHVMHADPSPFDYGVAAANTWDVGDAPITG